MDQYDSREQAEAPATPKPRDQRALAKVLLRLTAIALGVLFAITALGVYLTQGSPAVAKNNYMPRTSFVVILLIGVLCIATGVFGGWVVRLTTRFQPRSPLVAVVRQGPHGVTIRTHERRVLWMILVAVLGVLAFNGPWDGPQWLQHLPVQWADGYLAAVAILGLTGLWRAWRMALYIDDGGVTVRNLLRSYRFCWPEVARFTDGAALGGQSQVYWALTVVSSRGDAVTAAATTRSGDARPDLLTAICHAADRYGAAADVTGRRPPARGFYLDPGGQPGVRYFGGKTWSPLLPPEVVGGREPAILSEQVPGHLPGTGTWQVGRKAVRDLTARLVIFTAATVVLAASAAGIGPWAERGAHRATGWLYWAAFCAFSAVVQASRLRLWRKLNRAAIEAAATPNV